MDSILKKVKEEKKPFLGICVGMQMLASKGFENGEFLGLNWIEGSVKKIEKINHEIKIPHMGWDNLKFKKNNSFIKKLKEKLALQMFQLILFTVIIFIPKIQMIKL